MVTIELQNLGKRFNRHWIFRHVNFTFQPGTAYAITGANGSGKSTFLGVLAGAITLSEGSVLMTTDHGQQTTEDRPLTTTEGSIVSVENQQPLRGIHPSSVVRDPWSGIPSEQQHRYLSIAAPYLEVIEEMTLTEFLEFHFQFKPQLPGYTIPQIIECIQLKSAAHRQIRHYSSGMKQRVKLAQAIFSNVPVVLLDEPLTNLDTKGFELYNHLIQTFCLNRLLIICSNSEPEIHFCKERLEISKFDN